MYNTIERLYNNTKNKVVVKNAVKKGYITEDDYMKIAGEAYTQ